MEHRAEALGEVAWELLQRLVRDKLARRPGGHLVEGKLGTLELRLPLPLSGSEATAAFFSERLSAAIDELLDEAIRQAAAFRPGRAYCHRCEGVDCAHSLPPSCRHVFAGYAPTGTPRWEDFAQLCLERHHPGVDRLYDEKPALLTLIHPPQELHGGMVAAFRQGSYELLGQLTAGFFPVRTRAEEGRGVVGLTVQVAASYARGKRPRVGLNLLGRSPSGEGLERLWERHEELPWRKSVRWAQGALQTLVPRRPSRGRPTESPPEGLEARVMGILQGLARRLEREQRARSRRTQHAERRHISGERPTRKAIEDARQAQPDALLVDERSGTVVVLGERGRTHFFTLEGQHVSSVRYSREAIARKLKIEQWRRASEEQTAEFRRILGSVG